MLDAIFKRYGWDFWTYQDQPEWLIQELIQVMAAEGDHAKALRDKADGKPQPIEDHDEMMKAARAEGFLPAIVPEL